MRGSILSFLAAVILSIVAQATVAQEPEDDVGVEIVSLHARSPRSSAVASGNRLSPQWFILIYVTPTGTGDEALCDHRTLRKYTQAETAAGPDQEIVLRSQHGGTSGPLR